MYTTSTDYDTQIQKDSRTFRARITVGDTVLEDDITNIKMYLGSCGSSAFSIGVVFTGYAEIVLSCTDVALADKEMFIEIGLVLPDESVEYVPMGYFTPSSDKVKIVRDRTTCTAYDRMAKTSSINYEPTVEFPATIANVISDLSSQLGITISTSLSTTSTIEEEMTGLTGQQALCYLAGLLGGFAYADKEGNIVIAQYPTTASLEVDADRSLDDVSTGEGEYTLEALAVTVTAETVDSNGNTIDAVIYTSGSGTALSVSNPYMTETQFNKIKGNVVGYSFYSGSLKFLGDPRLDASDAITAYDYLNVDYFLPCMAITQYYDGGMTTTIDTPGLASSSDVSGPTQQAVEKLADDLTYISNKISTTIVTVDSLTEQYAQLYIDYSGLYSEVNAVIQSMAYAGVVNRNYALLSGNYEADGESGFFLFASSSSVMNVADNYYTVTLYDGYTRIECIENASNTYYAMLNLSDDFDPSPTYTITIKIRVSTAIAVSLYSYSKTGTSSYAFGSISTIAASKFTAGEWLTYTCTFTPNANYTYLYIGINLTNMKTAGYYADIEYIMLEQGEEAHDWEPAPEDSNAIQYVTAIETKFTSIQETVDGITATVSDVKETADSALTQSSEAVQTAEGISTTVSSVEQFIGMYTNYALTSGNYSEDSDVSNWYSSTSNFSTYYTVSACDGYVRLECIKSTTGTYYVFLKLSENLDATQTCTISMRVRCSNTTGYGIRLRRYDSDGTYSTSSISTASSGLTENEWTVISASFTPSSSYTYEGVGIYISSSSFTARTAGDYIDFSYIMVEPGSEAHEWCPSEEDEIYTSYAMTKFQQLSDAFEWAVYKDSEYGYLRLGSGDDGTVQFTVEASNFSIDEFGNAVFGYEDGKHVNITTTDLEICDDETVLASFGETTTIGDTSYGYAEVTYNTFSLIDKDGEAFFSVTDGRDKENIAICNTTFTGDGTTTAYTTPYTIISLAYVSLNGTVTTDYTYDSSTSTITFTSAPSTGTIIKIKFTYNVTTESEVHALEMTGDMQIDGDVYCSNIGDFYTASEDIETSTSGEADYNGGASITVPAGVYILFAKGVFESNTTGANRRIRIYNFTDQKSITTEANYGTGFVSIHCSVPYVFSKKTMLMCMASNGGSVSLSCGTTIQAMRIR